MESKLSTVGRGLKEQRIGRRGTCSCSARVMPPKKLPKLGPAQHTICDLSALKWKKGAAAGSSLKGHSNWMTSVAFNQEGTLLASSSYDETVKIWDPASGEEKCTLMGDLPIWSVAFSAGGHCIAAGCGDESEGEILIFKLQESGDWEMQSECPLTGHRYDPFSCIECLLS